MVGGAENVALGVGIVEGAIGVGSMISIGILACYACGGCSFCGNSGGAGISEALGGAT